MSVQAGFQEPEVNSGEMATQAKREESVLRAIYFNVESIPDSPAEAPSERHVSLDSVKVIPFEDVAKAAQVVPSNVLTCSDCSAVILDRQA